MSQSITMSPEDLQATVTRAVQAAQAATAAAPAPAAPAAMPMMPAAAMPAPGWGPNVSPGPWAAPTPTMMPAGAMPGTAPQASGLAVKLRVPLPDGREMPVDLHFGAEYATPQGIVALAGALFAAGFPVQAYQPRQQGWGGGRGGFGGGGGFHRGGRGGFGAGGNYVRGGGYGYGDRGGWGG